MESKGKYQVMPELSDEDYAALKADIDDRGVQVPVELDEDGNVLDGFHRVQACEELGIEDYPTFVRPGMTEAEKRTHARQLNLARRHLTRQQKRELIAQQLKETPEVSDRQIAVGLGVSPTTVGTVRSDMEESGDVSKLDTSTDTLGREQPRNKERRHKQTVLFSQDAKQTEKTLSVVDAVADDKEKRQKLEQGKVSVDGLEKQIKKEERQASRRQEILNKPVRDWTPADIQIFNCDSRLMDAQLTDLSERNHTIEDDSIHLVLTSPPYNNGTEYDTYNDDLPWEDYFGMLKEVFSACYKKMIEGGRIAVNIPNLTKFQGKEQKFPIFDMWQILTECGFLAREFITWVKTKSGKEEAALEDSIAALLARSTAWGSWASPSNASLRSITEFVIVMHKECARLEGGEGDITEDEFRKWTSNVWFIPAVSNDDHPAVFPVELAKRIIRLYSYRGQTVLDPFMGIGTTGLACQHRRFVGFDVSEFYCKVAYGLLENGNPHRD